ncbi:DUF3168 domain-containing protein [Suttonella ornithocola]|uniref:Protein of uncharacterized function (DUF3168) n=1 Tax=Suttonella ornithocola TaxID=279832 RepID=A0A380MSI3_9GAMM|nr:DUF3168 domain-containing protein [Suttonella ornithocola]SUO95262.1 Protein of uncharacterised function (DUF3168) [Suttonella ornithocola]
MISIFPIITASSECKRLLGENPTRFYPFHSAPQNGALPYVVWQIVSGQPLNELKDGPAGDHYTVQIDVYDTKSIPARIVAMAVRDALQKDNRVTITNWALEAHEPDTKIHRVSFDCDFIQSGA